MDNLDINACRINAFYHQQRTRNSKHIRVKHLQKHEEVQVKSNKMTELMEDTKINTEDIKVEKQ